MCVTENLHVLGYGASLASPPQLQYRLLPPGVRNCCEAFGPSQHFGLMTEVLLSQNPGTLINFQILLVTLHTRTLSGIIITRISKIYNIKKSKK